MPATSFHAAARLLLCAVLAFLLTPRASGNGLQVMVVVNQNSTNSVQLGNYYLEQRQIPPQNLLRTQWGGGAVSWTRTQFENILMTPLQAALLERGLTNQIQFVVLSMDIPYQVISSNGLNSTTSALHYGFHPDNAAPGPGLPDSCSLPATSFSSYAGSEDIFRQAGPGTNANHFLVTMLTASNLTSALRLVDQGVASDGTFPIQPVVLSKSTDWARNIRYTRFDNAAFNLRLRGCTVVRTNSNTPAGLTNLLGFQIGVHKFTISSNVFIPGAIADSLTSFSGNIFEPHDHTTLLAFIHAGASGSYGTVIEPCAYLQKFPDPQVYFYQSRGFTLAEAYYQSISNPYQGLIVAEPLAAPFANPASGSWMDTNSILMLNGITNLSVQFSASEIQKPIQQIDLFLNGRFLHTVTNIDPAQGNLLHVTLPGATNLTYEVPPGATLRSVASGVASVLNGVSNVTQVSAITRGDRIKLQSFHPARSGPDTSLTVSNSSGAAATLTTQLHASSPAFLDSDAFGLREIVIGGFVVAGDDLNLTVLKTNGATVNVNITNAAAGPTLMQFVQQFLTAINNTPSLQGPDGVVAEDLVQAGADFVRFNLRVRSPGRDAAQVQAAVTGSFLISPSTTNTLTGNAPDLRPRNHLYVMAGSQSVSPSFAFNSTSHPDGFHTLTAVAYEGSHVRTSARIDRTIQISNNGWTAQFDLAVGGTNIAREAAIEAVVSASTNSITRIDLFSTGGLIASSTNESISTFMIPALSLDVGLHPLYAIVTRSGGQQYRTATRWIRVIGPEPQFAIQASTPPMTLHWPATAGRQYDILSTTNLSLPFELRHSITPTNPAGIWIETNTIDAQRFYRVRAVP